METKSSYYHVLGFFLGPVIVWLIMMGISFESLTLAQGMALGSLAGFYAGHLVDKQKDNS